MSEDEVKILLSCVPPFNLKQHDIEGMWIEFPQPEQANELTDGPILHVNSSIVIDLDIVEANVIKNNCEMIKVKDEHLIYKPR